MTNIDQLRDAIWEDLFQHKTSKSIDQIASNANCDPAEVRAAVGHEWFTLSGERVSIAYAGPGQQETAEPTSRRADSIA